MGVIRGAALALALVLATGAARADDPAEARLKAEAARLQACFAAEWAECAVDFMDQAVVEHFGGTERVRRAVRNATASMAERGTLAQFKRTTLTLVSQVVTIGDRRYAKFQSRLPMVSRGQPGTIIGTTVAVSRDDGATWRFVDATERMRPQLEQFFPGAWDRLALTDARFEPDR